MNFRTVILLLAISIYGTVATPPSLLALLPGLFPALSLTNLLPFPLALPIAMLGPLSLALPAVVGFKGATLIGLGFGLGGFTGAGLAGAGAIGLKAALLNTAALKLGAVGTAAAKATVAASAASVGAKALVGAGSKALVGAKSKAVVAAKSKVAPVIAAPTVHIAVPPVVPKVKVFKTPAAVPFKFRGPVSADPWNSFAWPAGWDHTLSLMHPVHGYSYTRTAIQMRKDAGEDPVPQMDPIQMKNAFEYLSTVDQDRCARRLICEIAADPSILGERGLEVAEYMTSLPDDTSAPWMPFREAAMLGQNFASRSRCYQTYPNCSSTAAEAIEIARARIAAHVAGQSG